MRPTEGVPWTPRKIDELLDEPFRELEERQPDAVLTRLDEIDKQLDTIERDLDALLEACR